VKAKQPSRERPRTADQTPSAEAVFESRRSPILGWLASAGVTAAQARLSGRCWGPDLLSEQHL